MGIILAVWGMVLSLVVTIYLAAFSTPWWVDYLKKSTEEGNIAPARELKEEIKEQGVVKDVDALDEGVDFPVVGNQELQKVEQIEGSLGQLRSHFENTTEKGHSQNFSEALDNSREQIVRKSRSQP